MFVIMRFQGMPDTFVDLIKRMYEDATITVRISPDGSQSAEKFSQRRGIRQECSLSPAIFVLVLDFAMRNFQKTCGEKGIEATEERFWIWLGYADDLVLNATSEEEATTMLAELQGVAQFVGLSVIKSKTEVMPLGISAPVVEQGKACKEKAELTFLDGAKATG